MTRYRVHLGDQVFDRWNQIQVDSDLLTPSDGWAVALSLGVAPSGEERRMIERLRALQPPLRAEVWRDDVQLLTGIWDGRSSDTTRGGGTTWTIEGRDVAAYLVDSSVPLGLTVDAETYFVDLVQAVVDPWDLTVSVDSTGARHILTGRSRSEADTRRMARERAIDRGIAADLYQRELDRRYENARAQSVEGGLPTGALIRPLTDEEILDSLGDDGEVARLRSRRRYAAGISPYDVERIRVREARPRAGETAWAFLDRHARRLGVLLWAGPDGRIICASPNTGSEAVQRIVRRERPDPSDPNNVIGGGARLDAAGVFSKTIVYGRGPQDNASRSRFVGTAADDSVPWQRLRIIHDAGIRSQDEADRRAKREARVSSMRSRVFAYTIAGHENAGQLWAPDTMVHVEDDVEGLSEPLYVYRRTFLASKADGEITKLYLVPAGAIAW